MNGAIIHIWVFADGESLRAWAEEWRREYQAEGWKEESVGEAGRTVQ